MQYFFVLFRSQRYYAYILFTLLAFVAHPDGIPHPSFFPCWHSSHALYSSVATSIDHLTFLIDLVGIVSFADLIGSVGLAGLIGLASLIGLIGNIGLIGLVGLASLVGHVDSRVLSIC